MCVYGGRLGWGCLAVSVLPGCWMFVFDFDTKNEKKQTSKMGFKIGYVSNRNVNKPDMELDPTRKDPSQQKGIYWNLNISELRPNMDILTLLVFPIMYCEFSILRSRNKFRNNPFVVKTAKYQVSNLFVILYKVTEI